MKSGSFVTCISLLQLIIGLALLGVYESYKVSYMNRSVVSQQHKDTDHSPNDGKRPPDADATENPVQLSPSVSIPTVDTPLDWLFYLSIFNNVFSLFFCLAGLLNALKELIAVFAVFNAVHVVLTFHYFIDVWTDARVRKWSDGDMGKAEKAATAFLFFSFALAFISTVFAVKALQEIRHKAREEYNRLSVISDNLQFETDVEKL